MVGEKAFKMLNLFLYSDHSYPWAMGFQDPATNALYAIVDLHDRIIFYLIVLLVLVSWFLISSMVNRDHMAHLHHGNTLEFWWTLLPAVILWLIGLPSLRLLYMIDELLDPQLTIKAIGSQWFWSYEYTDYSSVAFDSFLVSEADLE
jgi:cytochrome c oxidase subunit 2